MYQNFFIRSSVDGHLGCFEVLAIVNSAAMNNRIYVSFSILVFSETCVVSAWSRASVTLRWELGGEGATYGPNVSKTFTVLLEI